MHETVFVQHSGATSNFATSPFQVQNTVVNHYPSNSSTQNQFRSQARPINASPRPMQPTTLMTNSQHSQRNRNTFYSPPANPQFMNAHRNVRVVSSGNNNFNVRPQIQFSSSASKPINHQHVESSPRLQSHSEIERVEAQQGTVIQKLESSVERVEQSERKP